MGILGTILSVIPTVAGVIGDLFNANKNDYVRVRMYQPSKSNEEPDVYFVKTEDDRILLYNSCGYPVQISMDSVGVSGDDDYIVEDCSGGKDVTDLISTHAAKYIDNLRLSVNMGDLQADAIQTVPLVYSSKLDRDIEGSVCIGKYASVEAMDNDFILIIHSGCTLKEINSLVISGEGNEPVRSYENVNPEAVIPEFQPSLCVTGEDDVQTVVFKNAISSFQYSKILTIEVILVCDIEESGKKRLTSAERQYVLASQEWDFIRKGRCVREI